MVRNHSTHWEDFGRLRVGRPLGVAGSILLLWAAGGPAANAQAKDKAAVPLRSTVAEWVGTMQRIQELQSRWKREQQILESNKEGLEQEIVDLEQSIAETRARLETNAAEDREKLEMKRGYDAAREALAVALTATEAEARRVIPLIPDFFLAENDRLKGAVAELKKTDSYSDEEKSRNLGSRLNSMTLVLSEMQKFQAQNWVRQEQRVVDGKELIVQTIYFGLATALAADAQKTVALRGHSSEQGWSFERLPDGDAPAQILELIDVASLKGEIKFVEVPLELR